MIAPAAAPPLPPPAIVQPVPYQASFGLVTGTVGPGVVRIRVHAGHLLLADRPLRGRRFSLRVELPLRDSTVRVTALDVRGRRRTSIVGPVFGLPRSAEPRVSGAHVDAKLSRTVRRLTAAFPGTSAVYVQELGSGAGAAWNARARFPAASTLKLAVAMAVLRAADGVPPPGSRLGVLLHELLVHSDNRAANELEAWLGGSTLAGSAVVDAMLRSLGLFDTTMYGGYETSDLRRLQAGIPIRVESQPAFGLGKYTTAFDLARLWRDVWQAAAGLGPAVREFPGGFTPADARYLLRLLGLVHDRGKLDRFLAPRDVLLHKAGWISTARHDAGLVLWDGGAVLATVLTWTPRGAGSSADVLAGRVARATRDRFAG